MQLWCTTSSTVEDELEDDEEAPPPGTCAMLGHRCEAPLAVRSCFGRQTLTPQPAPHLNPIPEACKEKLYADADDGSEFPLSRQTVGGASSSSSALGRNLGEIQRRPLPKIDFSALRDPDWEKRREAVSKLGFCYLGTQPNDLNSDVAALIMPALRAAIRDEHWEVREQAVLAIHDLGHQAVVLAAPVLWEACGDLEQPVRIAAVQALEAHGQDKPPQHMQQPRLHPRSWQAPPRLQSVREDSMSSTTASCSNVNSARASFSDFTVSVAKSVDSQLGIEVDYTDDTALKVSNVFDGVINEWNKASVSPIVERGDVIATVNGRHGTARQLMDMIVRSEWLEVLVRKPETAQSELSYVSFIISN